jgi:hypothetical protein
MLIFLLFEKTNIHPAHQPDEWRFPPQEIDAGPTIINR